MTKLLSGNKRKQGGVEKSNKTKTEGLQNKKERGKKCDGALQGFVLMFFTTRGPSERLS